MKTDSRDEGSVHGFLFEFDMAVLALAAETDIVTEIT